jgi:hypothetical protein
MKQHEPKDKDTFPFGALTQKGGHQMQTLGEHLKTRYNYTCMLNDGVFETEC